MVKHKDNTKLYFGIFFLVLIGVGIFLLTRKKNDNGYRDTGGGYGRGGSGERGSGGSGGSGEDKTKCFFNGEKECELCKNDDSIANDIKCLKCNKFDENKNPNEGLCINLLKNDNPNCSNEYKQYYDITSCKSNNPINNDDDDRNNNISTCNCPHTDFTIKGNDPKTDPNYKCFTDALKLPVNYKYWHTGDDNINNCKRQIEQNDIKGLPPCGNASFNQAVCQYANKL